MELFHQRTCLLCLTHLFNMQYFSNYTSKHPIPKKGFKRPLSPSEIGGKQFSADS